MLQKSYRTSFVILIAVGCFAPMAFGDCPQTAAPANEACMYLQNAGYTGGFAGVYVGPYTATINDGTPTAVICDDYKDESYIPEYWTADIVKGSSGVSGVPGDLTTTRDAQLTPTLTGTQLQQAYDEVGYLSLQLLATPVTDVNTVGEIHFALWSVFDPQALVDLNTAVGGNNIYTAAQADLANAINVVTGIGGYNGGKGDMASNYSSYISQFTIYTPAGPPSQICIGGTTPSSCSSGYGVPQEFLVRTPEPPFFALLGVDLSGVGALIFLMRRRRSTRS
jgi:hypothetical protein